MGLPLLGLVPIDATQHGGVHGKEGGLPVRTLLKKVGDGQLLVGGFLLKHPIRGKDLCVTSGLIILDGLFEFLTHSFKACFDFPPPALQAIRGGLRSFWSIVMGILFCLLGRGRDVGIFRCPRGSICLGEGGDFLRHAIEGLFLAMKLTHLDEAFNPSLVVCVASVEGLTVILPQT